MENESKISHRLSYKQQNNKALDHHKARLIENYTEISKPCSIYLKKNAFFRQKTHYLETIKRIHKYLKFISNKTKWVK